MVHIKMLHNPFVRTALSAVAIGLCLPAFLAAQTVTKIVPHIAFGSFEPADNRHSGYEAFMLVSNLTNAPITVSASFFTQSGTPSTIQYGSVLNGTTSGFTGNMPATTLPANSTMLVGPDVGIDANGGVNWAQFTGTGNFGVATLYNRKVYPPFPERVVSTVGVAASPGDMRQFVIPRVRDTAPAVNADVGFAVVNTGATAATITGTLRNAEGATVTSRTIILNARSQMAVYSSQFFTGLVDSGISWGTIEFSSTSPQFAAIALGSGHGIESSVAVERIQ